MELKDLKAKLRRLKARGSTRGFESRLVIQGRGALAGVQYVDPELELPLLRPGDYDVTVQAIEKSGEPIAEPLLQAIVSIETPPDPERSQPPASSAAPDIAGILREQQGFMARVMEQQRELSRENEARSQNFFQAMLELNQKAAERERELMREQFDRQSDMFKENLRTWREMVQNGEGLEEGYGPAIEKIADVARELAPQIIDALALRRKEGAPV